MKWKQSLVLGLILCAALGTLAFAAEEKGAGMAAANNGAGFYFGMTVLAAGLGIAIGTLATGLAQGNAVAKAVEGIARQPEAAGTIQTVMIIGLAFIESLTIYVLLISLILLFVNPFEKYFH